MKETTAQLPSSHPRSPNRRKFFGAVCVCARVLISAGFKEAEPASGGKRSVWPRRPCASPVSLSLISSCVATSWVGCLPFLYWLLCSLPQSAFFSRFPFLSLLLLFWLQKQETLNCNDMLTEWFKPVVDLKTKGLEKKMIKLSAFKWDCGSLPLKVLLNGCDFCP